MKCGSWHFSVWLLLSILLFGLLQGGISCASSGPQRIISLGPIHTENIYLLGAEDRLIANTIYCNRPAQAREKMKIGSVMQANVEQIVSLQPDLILATSLTSPALINKLNGMGLNVVRFSQPQSFEQICNQFIQLGELLGLEEKAKSIVGQAEDQVERVKKAVAGFPLKRVFIQVGAQPLFGSVSSSFTNDFIVLSGSENILAKEKNGGCSREKVISLNPDVIIVAIMGSQTGEGANQKKLWFSFPTIHACSNKQVYVIDPDVVCSPSPLTFAQTLTTIAGLIHPEADLKFKK
ncbi:ABC transporter substrate-binding protein [Desulfogranum japonicum]|uniref:ABC transporter substrate-binding protein n=1 Tax=Desulfogranum japonicum TaxID=231447 RepID=UPI00040E8820|nr:ABC transporter substrate-binding protein [Desulfogranum japonicum]